MNDDDVPTLSPAADDPLVPVAPAAPSSGLGLLKLLVGVPLALMFTGGLINEGYQGRGLSVVFGLFIGLGLRWSFTGLANLAGKRPGRLAALAPLILLAVLCALVGPGMSASHYVSREKKLWDRHKDGIDVSFWTRTYSKKVPEKFRRPEYPQQRMLVRARHAASARDGQKLRDVIRDIRKQPTASQADFQPAMDEAARGLKKIYDAGLAKLSVKPVGAGKQQVAVDEKLRSAFKKMLDDLAQAESADVFLLFNSSASLVRPPDADRWLERFRRDPQALKSFPKADAPVLAKGGAFDKRRDGARRATFHAAMQQAFGRIFGAQLITLKTLEDPAQVKGKLVFKVISQVARVPGYYFYRRGQGASKRVTGLLFKITTRWQFELLDRAGKQLYRSPVLASEPASQISLNLQGGEPPWAPYSIMMDSAYYNYSRIVIGRFGLAPPPERRSFRFK